MDVEAPVDKAGQGEARSVRQVRQVKKICFSPALERSRRAGRQIYSGPGNVSQSSGRGPWGRGSEAGTGAEMDRG